MSNAPDFGNDYPSGGERIGPAWTEIWNVLGDGEWHTARDIAPHVERWIVEKTVFGLLRQAQVRKLLQGKIIRDPLRRRAFRRIL